MSPGTWPRRFATIIVVGTALLSVSRTPAAQQSTRDIDPNAVSVAVERALLGAPRDQQALLSPSQTGVRVLRVDVDRLSPDAQRITIDLNQRTLTYDAGGDMERLLDRLLTSTAPATADAGRVEYRFLVDGLPLEQFLTSPPAPARLRAQATSSTRALISAGHGWYWHEESNSWRLQRDYYWGIVEDLVNWEIASYVHEELRAAHIDVVPVRDPQRDSRAGVSGRPMWQESARYFLQALGMPQEVWGVGANEYNRDINTRPLYSNWIDADVMISIHNNGGGGTGTETWFDATNGHEAESQRLAQRINDAVVAAIRARYNRDWPDRGLRSCNGCKGENRIAARPAIIVETAFMDTKSPDNDALHSEAFKQIVAQGIRDGLEAWAGAGR